MKEYLRKIGINFGAQTFSKFISLALGLLNVGLITRYLGESGYGNFILVFAYFSFFGVLADFGFHLTMVRELAGNKVKGNVYSTFFSLKLIFVFFSLFFALLILPFFPYDNFVRTGIILGALSSSIGILNNYGTSIFQSKLRLDLVAILEMITKISTTLFVFLFVHLNLGFYFVIMSVFFGNLLGSFFIYLNLLRFAPLSPTLNIKIAKKIIYNSFPVFLISLLSILYFKLDIIILSFFRSSEEVGAYGLSYKMIENLLVFWGFFMATLYPLFSKFKGNAPKRKKLFNSSFIVALILSFGIIFLLFPLAPLIIHLIAGEHFYQSRFLLRILLFALPFLFINNLYLHFFLSIGKTRVIINSILVSLVLSIGLNLITIPFFGAIAAAINTCVVEIFLLVAYLFFFKINSRKDVMIDG